MKRILILTYLVLMPFTILIAQTNIPAGNVSGTWSKANSPYLINGDIKVPDDSLLTIEAGVRVEFQNDYRLTVDGSIVSNGKSGDSIYFVPKYKNLGWSGLLFLNNNDGDSGVFSHCVFRFIIAGGVKRTDGGALLVNNKYLNNAVILAFHSNNIRVKSSVFETNWRSIYTYNSKGDFEDCFFTKHDGSNGWDNDLIGIIDSSSFLFEDCNFSNNTRTKTIGQHGLIFTNNLGVNSSMVTNSMFTDNIACNLGLGPGSSVLVDSCIFKNDSANNGGAMSVNSSNSLISNCVFDGNTAGYFGGAVYVTGSCYFTQFDHCIFKNNDGKQVTLLFKGSTASPSITNCVFENNSPSISAVGFIEGSDYGRIINCLFVGNGFGVGIGSGSNHVIANCAFINNASTLRNEGGGIVIAVNNVKVYNSILWGNTDPDNKKVQVLLENNNNNAAFYNCIIEGDSTGFRKGINNNLNWNGVYQDCYSSYPDFTDSLNRDFTLLNSCLKTSYAYNKGFSGFIRDPQYPSLNVLTYYTQKDLNENTRIIDDSIDIGPYEIIAPKDRLIITEQPKGFTTCYGVDTSLSISGIGNDISYNWEYTDNGSTWATAGIGSQLQISSTSAGFDGRKYRVKLSDVCSRSLTSSEAEVSIKPLPIVNLGQDKTIDDWGKETLDAGMHTSYLWNDNSDLQTLEVDGHAKGLGKHLYWVEVKNADGCVSQDSINITVDDITGILDNNTLALSIYPNPVKDQLTIILPKGIQKGVISIYTLMGKLVLTQETNEANSSINLRGIESGTYIIKFSSQKKAYYGRVVTSKTNY